MIRVTVHRIVLERYWHKTPKVAYLAPNILRWCEATFGEMDGSWRIEMNGCVPEPENDIVLGEADVNIIFDRAEDAAMFRLRWVR